MNDDLPNLRIMNAAGRCKDLHEVRRLCLTPVTDIVIGSITVSPREGNPGHPFWTNETGTSLNSLGIPNGGIPYYEKKLPEMVNEIRKNWKKSRLSIAGFSPEEYGKLAELADRSGIHEIEVNLGCPNILQKDIPSFDLGLTEEILRVVELHTSLQPISVKMSPLDPGLLKKSAAVIKSFGKRIGSVVTMNTYPNAFAFEESNKHAIPGTGLGGLGGKAVKYIALGQIKQWREYLPESVEIIGVGGINTGMDIADCLSAGASGVQVGTHYFNHDPKVFGELIESYLSYKELNGD